MGGLCLGYQLCFRSIALAAGDTILQERATHRIPLGDANGFGDCLDCGFVDRLRSTRETESLFSSTLLKSVSVCSETRRNLGTITYSIS